jgi:hypothetical protein
MRGHKGLYLVPSRQQMGAIDRQLVGQMLSGGALRNAAQDLDDRGTGIAGLPEDGAGEQVEDRAALPTAVIRSDRSPSPALGLPPAHQQERNRS